MSRPLNKSGDSSRHPVLIVNGFSFLPYFQPFPTHGCLKAYRERGFDPIRRVPWRPGSMYNVRTYAVQVNRHVDSLLAETGASRLCLVGWSMGGIACLYAMIHLGMAHRVRALTCFGSPFQGIHRSWQVLVHLHAIRSIWQLTSKSRLLTDLQAAPLPPGIPIHSIGGRRDLICPPGSTVLKGAKNLVTGHGHESFLYDTGLHRLISQLLLKTG